MSTPVSAPIIEAETDKKAKASVNEDKNWIPWTDKSKDTPFKSNRGSGIGDGEYKMGKELNTPVQGQNSPYDMMPLLNGIVTKCDVKKLDKQDDFNTGVNGRDVLRPIKALHAELLESIKIFVKSARFTDDEKAKLELKVKKPNKDVSPDELSVGNLKILEEICHMLKKKKEELRSKLPGVEFNACGEDGKMPLELFYTLYQTLRRDFPPKFSSYIDAILILQKMDHIYIDNPSKFREDLNALVGKVFTDMKLIIVHETKGYFILENIEKIQFLRITKGHPRFKVIF